MQRPGKLHHVHQERRKELQVHEGRRVQGGRHVLRRRRVPTFRWRARPRRWTPSTPARRRRCGGGVGVCVDEGRRRRRSSRLAAAKSPRPRPVHREDGVVAPAAGKRRRKPHASGRGRRTAEGGEGGGGEGGGGRRLPRGRRLFSCDTGKVSVAKAKAPRAPVKCGTTAGWYTKVYGEERRRRRWRQGRKADGRGQSRRPGRSALRLEDARLVRMPDGVRLADAVCPLPHLRPQVTRRHSRVSPRHALLTPPRPHLSPLLPHLRPQLVIDRPAQGAVARREDGRAVHVAAPGARNSARNSARGAHSARSSLTPRPLPLRRSQRT